MQGFDKYLSKYPSPLSALLECQAGVARRVLHLGTAGSSPPHSFHVGNDHRMVADDAVARSKVKEERALGAERVPNSMPASMHWEDQGSRKGLRFHEPSLMTRLQFAQHLRLPKLD